MEKILDIYVHFNWSEITKGIFFFFLLGNRICASAITYLCFSIHYVLI